MRATKTMATVLCVMALMVGSGYIGANLARRGAGYAPPVAPIIEAFLPADDTSMQLLTQRNFTRVMAMPDLFDYANPAVVAISTQIAGRNAFGQQVSRPSAGSGFLISPDGYIVTNNHVIESAQEIIVLMYDGREFPAVVTGRDPLTDLAVIKIDVSGFPYLQFGDSDAARVGELVAAIGNPLGQLANSMTVGHISALNRDVFIDGTYYNKLQTDAAINRGNSGGPLLNTYGEVIAVVSAKHTGSDVEGLGFAIPANQAQTVTADLINYGFVRGRAILGVSISSHHPREVRVALVAENGPAANAGLRPGDIILHANNQPLNSFADLRAILDKSTPGQAFEMHIRRQGEELTLIAILEERGKE